MEKMIKVPEGMLKAFGEAYDHQKGLGANSETCERFGLESALRWLSKNPIVPTDEQAQVMLEKVFNDPPFIYSSPNDEMPGQNILINREQLTCPHLSREQEVFAEWQRRMFLAPEPEIPKDLCIPENSGMCTGTPVVLTSYANQRIIEAYRRGQRSKE